MAVLCTILAGAAAWLTLSLGAALTVGWLLRHRAAPRQTLQWTPEPRPPRVLLGALMIAAIVAGPLVMAVVG